MKTSRTVIVGTILISSILIFVLATFFISQDSCSRGTFRCGNSSFCIPQKSMCNGYGDCPNGEDETASTCADFYGSEFMINKLLQGVRQNSSLYQTCGLENIPSGCLCRNKTYLYCKNKGLTQVPSGIVGNVTRLILANNTITNLEDSTFVQYRQLQLIHLEGNQIESLPANLFQHQTALVKLLLMNNRLRELDRNLFRETRRLSILYAQKNFLTDSDLTAFEKATNLEYLDLSSNCIKLEIGFPDLKQLRELQLENNSIEEISADTFSQLRKLQFLNLRQNRIRQIHRNAFDRMEDLRELDLSHNLLSTLPEDVFSGLTHLSKLFIGRNPFHYLPSRLFAGLKNLSSLNLEEIEISNIDVGMFSMMDKLKFIYLKTFYYCTFAPTVRNCEPKTDGVSTSENLLGRPILRITVWIVAFVTCTGNVYVFWERLTTRDENRVLNWIVRNLAVSDFAMGIYLVVIGSKDIEYRGIYHRVSHEWISSWTCTTIGSIAMLSSEVSIIILVFMSLERFLLIAVPFGGHKNLNWKTSCFALGVIWIFGFSIAFVPVIHWRNSTKFYGANGMCFPLHMDDPYFAGWQFSAFVFIGINFLGILAIAFLYTGMFWSIWKTRHATTLNVGDFEFAIRFFFIVLTNTVCWAPVIVLKILAFLRIYISADVYSWISVFIIPVNSAFNPLLYTLTTPRYREVVRYTITRRMKPFGNFKQPISTADTISHTSSHKNAIGFCAVSVLSGTSKNNSFDLPTFNTSLDRTSSAGCDDFCASSQSTGQGSRGNSFDAPSVALENSTSEHYFHRETKCQGV